MHKEHKVYVPDLIFGHLLTSSNYDDDEKKVTGGRNGYGAKLANIFSTSFTVETVDSRQGLKYIQTFTDNMGSKTEPEITKVAKDKRGRGDYTRITFSPDLARFGMETLDDDVVALLKKRVHDMAGVTDASVKVYLNGTRIAATGFEKYVGLYVPDESAPRVFARINDRWEVCVSVSDGQFNQVSFVNAICTVKGGQHVDYIADQVTKEMVRLANRKNKGVQVKPHHVKNHLFVFVNALIENPAFDSQTKETLTTRSKAFGSTAELPPKFLKAVAAAGVVDRVLAWAKFKQTSELKRVGGSKKVNLSGIPKLNDANWAGGARSGQCTLILTEGDSAMTTAVSGLSVVGRDAYGVFPLKGKPLNVREATHASIMANTEISNIVKIMGLQFGKEYDSTKGLRYGHLLIMADQDHDGSHIKGLILNLLAHFWPSLLRVPGFLRQFITPIVKCTKGKQVLTFFTMPEYATWKAATSDGKGWNIKYYKGLGTSSPAEAKQYFSNLDTHVIDFGVASEDDVAALDLAFNKRRADDRKDWLLSRPMGAHVDYAVPAMEVREFVNKELILFSAADNVRSIPSMMDGLKPAQRKVLHGAFKRNLTKSEIKVAQLAGYVSEHCAYHHGDASLTATIVSMAQNFVGSNNVNLMHPGGQFGTRRMGGKDASSARYIFTKLAPIARALFHPDDDPLLEPQMEDGQKIEPTWYAPIIPLVLVNGSDGIGTGWSSFVPNHDPRAVIANIRALLDGEPMTPLAPWYRGFTGTITRKAPKASTAAGADAADSTATWIVRGVMEMDDEGDEDDGASVATSTASGPTSSLRITELPVRKWTDDYKAMLESMMPGADKDSKKKGAAKGKKKGAAKGKKDSDAGALAPVKGFKENHTDTTVDFTVTLTPEGAAEYRTPAALRKAFKMETKISTGNMHLFDAEGRIKRYASPEDLMREFYGTRMVLYAKRKASLLARMSSEWERLDNKVRFILEVIEGTLVVSNRPKAALLAELQERGYAMVDPSAKKAADDAADGILEDDEDAKVLTPSRGYHYLLSLPLWSLTAEKVDELRGELEEKEAALAKLRGTDPKDLWRQDLDALEVALDDADAELAADKEEEAKARRKYQRSRSGKAAGAKAKRGKAKKGATADVVDAKAGAAARMASAKVALEAVGADLPAGRPLPGAEGGDWSGSEDSDSDFEFEAASSRGGARRAGSVRSSRSSRTGRKTGGGAALPAVVEAAEPAPAPAPKAKAAKAKPKAAAKPAPKRTAAPVTTKVGYVSDSGSDSDGGMMTLAQRLAARAEASPPPAPPASKASRSRGAAGRKKAPSVVEDSDDDFGGSDDQFGFDGDSADEEEFTPDTPPKKPSKKAAASKKRATKKTATKGGKSGKKSAAGKRRTSDERSAPDLPEVPASPMAPSPAAKRSRRTGRSAAPAAKDLVAVQEAWESGSEASESMPPPRARGGRRAAARQAAKYTFSDDEGSESEFSEGWGSDDESGEEY